MDDERGAVTAEAAVVIPVLLLLTLGMAWLVDLGVVHARAVDAAREAARVVARGESAADAVALGRRVAGRGSSVGVRTGSGVVSVRVSRTVRGPGGFFAFLPGYTVHAEAWAARETS